MKDTLLAGATLTLEFAVDKGRTIDFLGDELRVYATPMFVQDAEITCRELILQHTDEGEDSVGTGIALSHSSATPLGLTVAITATVTSVDGPMIQFEISGNDGLDDIGKGTHGRFVTEIAKLQQRVRAKVEKAKQQ